MKKYTQENYNNAIRNLISNETPFSERTIGARNSLFVSGKIRAILQPNSILHLGSLEKGKFVSFLGNFSKNLYEAVIENPELCFMQIDFNGRARAKNEAVWKTIKDGDCFYNVDLKSAYWQIAHQLGYIKKDFFERYNTDEYKQAKRFCISFLARRVHCTYFDGGKSFRLIHCDTTVLKNIYGNIRKKLYICIAKAIESCNNEFIDYNIDAITIKKEQLSNVVKAFTDMGLDIKVTRCLKANNSQYYYGKEARNFTNKYIIK